MGGVSSVAVPDTEGRRWSPLPPSALVPRRFPCVPPHGAALSGLRLGIKMIECRTATALSRCDESRFNQLRQGVRHYAWRRLDLFFQYQPLDDALQRILG